MTDAAIEAARRVLADGRGLDEVVAPLRAAGLESIVLIKALREVTGLGLRDAVAVVEAVKDGRSLAHLTAERLPLIDRARRAGGGWWINHYCHAQFNDAPWLTMIPGSTGELGSVYYWQLPTLPPTADLWIAELIDPATPEQREAFRQRLAREPDLIKTHPGSISGPGVSYESLRAELREQSAVSSFWREHVEIVRDTDQSLTCRFRLTPT
jgi:hypothetical protein